MNANQKRLVTLEGDNPASRISGLIEMRHCLQKDVALAIGMSEQVLLLQNERPPILLCKGLQGARRLLQHQC